MVSRTNQPAPRGRGAHSNPEGRFESLRWEPTEDSWGHFDEDPTPHPTTLAPDRAKTVITRNRSPDIPFDYSINPYRGCEHGCPYCYARATHAYLNLSPGLDFETRIFYKAEAAGRLREELAHPGYRCRTVALGVNTDAYQPAERRLRITRKILEVLAEHRHPVSLVTKARLVERDLDLLQALAADQLVTVAISVTTLDDELNRKLEPRAAGGNGRLQTIQRLAAAGVPVAVMVAPVIPVLTDGEMETILTAAAERGAHAAGYVVLRLPHEVHEVFREWLETHFPLKADHVFERIRDVHGGRDYDTRFGRRMKGQGHYAEMLAQRFRVARRRLGLTASLPDLDTTRFLPPASGSAQLDLF